MKKRWLLIAGLLFLSGKSYGLNLSEAETEVRRLVKDTATSASLQRYSDTVIDSFLNQAQREVVTDTWCLFVSSGIVIISSTSLYDMPSDFLSVKFIQIRNPSGHLRAIKEVSFKSVLQSNPDYRMQMGESMEYFVRTISDFPVATSTAVTIVFMPTPTATSTGTIILHYYKQATDLSSDSDVFLDGNVELYPYHEAIVYKAVLKIKMIEGDTAGMAAYSQLYQTMISAMNSRLGESPNYSPGFSAGGSGLTGGNPR